MNRKGYLESFRRIDTEVENIQTEITKRREEIKPLENKINSLEEDLETKRKILEVIVGLEKTSNMEKPGEYHKSFYFVQKIKTNLLSGKPEYIFESDEPSMYAPCSECGQQYPLVMSHEQTFDSPDEDIWEQRAFVICPDDGVSQIAIAHQRY